VRSVQKSWVKNRPLFFRDFLCPWPADQQPCGQQGQWKDDGPIRKYEGNCPNAIGCPNSAVKTCPIPFPFHLMCFPVVVFCVLNCEAKSIPGESFSCCGRHAYEFEFIVH